MHAIQRRVCILTAALMSSAALAQNILKLCGYNSSIMYGDCESNGQIEGHSWNSLRDKDDNIFINLNPFTNIKIIKVIIKIIATK